MAVGVKDRTRGLNRHLVMETIQLVRRVCVSMKKQESAFIMLFETACHFPSELCGVAIKYTNLAPQSKMYNGEGFGKQLFRGNEVMGVYLPILGVCRTK